MDIPVNGELAGWVKRFESYASGLMRVREWERINPADIAAYSDAYLLFRHAGVNFATPFLITCFNTH